MDYWRRLGLNVGNNVPIHSVPNKEHHVTEQTELHDRLIELLGSSMEVHTLGQNGRKRKEQLEDSRELYTGDENHKNTSASD